MRRLALFACLLAFACKRREPAADKAVATPPAPSAACAKAKPHGALAWIEDDYASALACARERKVPLVIDLWAPWCHTCLAMQTTVFPDPSLGKDADKFVFVSLDTDREVNADAVGKFAPSAMPTFYVVGNDEQVLARFIGAATLAQFHEFLDAGARAAAGGGAVADSRFLGGQRALTKRDYATADEELTAALAAAPKDWVHRAEAVHALALVKTRRGDTKACLDVGEQYMEDAGATALGTNFVAFIDGCAEQAMETEPARAKAIRNKGIARMRELLADPKSPLSTDDRAEAMGYLRDALDGTGKPDEAKQVAEELRALLDRAMDSAKTPLEAMTHLWLRCEVYAYLGRPLELAPAVEKLAAQLPTEYDPPARLGWLYWKGGKLDQAATWTDKALALVYGPRKGRVLAQRAEIAAAAGDKATERTFREQAVKLWESLPAGQQSPDNLEKAKQALAALAAPAAGSASAAH